MGNERSPRPTVSVITTIYNSERFLAECIDSILSQEGVEFEMILVDDGSTDGGRDVLASFDDPRLKVEMARRRGRARALNRAISRARGGYLAIMDADDVAAPGRLAQQASFLDLHSSVGVVGSAYKILIDDGGSVIAQQVREERDDLQLRHCLLAGANPFHHSSVMLRAEVVRRVGGYDEHLPFSLDRDLYVRVAQHHGLGAIRAPASYVRVHAGRFFAGPTGPRRSKYLRVATALRLQYRITQRLGGGAHSLSRLLATLVQALLPGFVVRCIWFLVGRKQTSVPE